MRRVAIAIVTAISLRSATASADLSIWSLARMPDEAARRALIAEAAEKQLEYHWLARTTASHTPTKAEIATLIDLHIKPAIELLERADAGRSRDPFVRMQLAELLSLVGRHPEAVTVLESVARMSPPPALRARLWSSLAVDYAHVGRTLDEIDAYTKALETQPIPHERARLLANRAEGYMLLGDLTAAVDGYRAAIALMSLDTFKRSGATTLWGLAVALDRSGDLDGGLDAVRVARSYDLMDKQIKGPGWFYVPEYDVHWYDALGFWSAARLSDVAAVRVASYDQALASLRKYLASAPPDDKWLPLARARIKQCEKERAAFLKRAKDVVVKR